MNEVNGLMNWFSRSDLFQAERAAVEQQYGEEFCECGLREKLCRCQRETD